MRTVWIKSVLPKRNQKQRIVQPTVPPEQPTIVLLRDGWIRPTVWFLILNWYHRRVRIYAYRSTQVGSSSGRMDPSPTVWFLILKWQHRSTHLCVPFDSSLFFFGTDRSVPTVWFLILNLQHRRVRIYAYRVIQSVFFGTDRSVPYGLIFNINLTTP